jgi:hypothetical protein
MNEIDVRMRSDIIHRPVDDDEPRKNPAESISLFQFRGGEPLAKPVSWKAPSRICASIIELKQGLEEDRTWFDIIYASE